jgi:lysophospholipase L1-like esterase
MNIATIPTYRIYVSDPYDWLERHAQVVAANRKRNPEVILVGDSITHYWGGVPEHEIKRGADSFEWLYGPYRTVNMGFGFDGTEHVLWRLRNGALDEIAPKVAQVLIGTNDLSKCTDGEIAEGVEAVVSEIHSRLPRTRILLLGLLPRGPLSTYHGRIESVNALLAKLDGTCDGAVHFADPGRGVFLDEAGNCRTELYVDEGTHPNAEGNRRLARAIKPHLDALMAEYDGISP